MAILTKHSVVGYFAGFVSCALLGAAAFVVMSLVAMKSLGDRAFRLAPPPVPSARPVDYRFGFCDMTGSRHTLGEYRNRVVVLNLWATWCGPCRAEMPSLARLNRSLSADRGAAVICISEEPLADIRLKKVPDTAGLPLFSCSGGAVPDGLRSEIIPATYVIGRDGRVAFSHVGSADWSDQAVIGLIHGLERGRGP